MTYSCRDHEPRSGKIIPLLVQDGWTPKGERVTKLIYPQWEDVECGHTISQLDDECDGCRWRRG